MKIFVVGSKKNKFLKLDNIREKFIVDEKHSGDNIDFLNPWYCELTGLYYLWKNIDDDIVGLEHYRNYFWKNGHPINEAEIKEELKKGDIICGGYSYPFCKHKILFSEFNKVTKGAAPIIFETISNHDDGLAKYFKNFLNGKRLWCCNTFIGPKKIFDEWAEFAFNLLVDIEKKSPIGPKTNTLRREGYITEFLFGAWLEYKGYKIIHCDMHKFDKSLRKLIMEVKGPDKTIKGWE